MVFLSVSFWSPEEVKQHEHDDDEHVFALTARDSARHTAACFLRLEITS